MGLHWQQWAGIIGFWLIEGSYLPQIQLLYRLKEAEEFSLLFPSANLIGRVLALIYAFSRHESVFVLGFALGIVLRLILLSQVVWYRRRRRLLLRLEEEAVSI